MRGIFLTGLTGLGGRQILDRRNMKDMKGRQQAFSVNRRTESRVSDGHRPPLH
jgi:hypothetical protein